MSIALWRKLQELEARLKSIEERMLATIERSPELDHLLQNLDRFERLLGKYTGKGNSKSV